VFERLVEYDPTTETVGPMLAETWQENKDNTSITFFLRNGVEFHPNAMGVSELFTSHDVVATFNRITDPSGSNFVAIQDSLMRKGVASFREIDQVQAIDDYTVRFEFNNPQPSFFADLASSSASIQSRHELKMFLANGGQFPLIGTGQYKVESIEPNVKAQYQANTQHWLDEPLFETMEIVAIPDVSARAARLAVGDCDVAYVPKNQHDVFMEMGGNEIFLLPEQYIAAGRNLTCLEVDSRFGNLASACVPSIGAASQRGDGCPACPPSGACPQSILAARNKCCPKSGACTQ